MQKLVRFAPSLVLVLFGLVMSACGSTSNQQAALASGEITVKTSEWKFEPSSIRVEAGKPIKLVLKNEGKIEHNVAVLGIMASGKELQLAAKAGESTTIEFTPDKAGVFELVCTLPGHKDAGMVGKLEIVGGQ